MSVNTKYILIIISFFVAFALIKQNDNEYLHYIEVHRSLEVANEKIKNGMTKDEVLNKVSKYPTGTKIKPDSIYKQPNGNTSICWNVHSHQGQLRELLGLNRHYLKDFRTLCAEFDINDLLISRYYGG